MMPSSPVIPKMRLDETKGRQSCRMRVKGRLLRNSDHDAARFEHDLQTATPIPAMKKPFDLIAEGLFSQNSRGDRI